MAYRQVYFRIRSLYEGYQGWPHDGDELPFREETRRLFQNAGWTLQEGSDSGCSDTVFKGQQDLYLHPMNFSGVMLEEEIPQVEALLAQAKTFHCYGIDRYEEYLDLSDEAYWALLESKREEITAAILECCRTKRRNLYVTSPFTMSIADRFSVCRICDKENHRNQAYPYVSQLVKQLIADGRLITAETRSGIGLRTAAKKDIRGTQAG